MRRFDYALKTLHPETAGPQVLPGNFPIVIGRPGRFTSCSFADVKEIGESVDRVAREGSDDRVRERLARSLQTYWMSMIELG